MSGPTVGAMFAGYEGIGLALEDVLDATPAWFAEFDAAPSKILAHHFPDVPNYGDVTQIDWATVPHVDIITGGSPCQDMSTAGKRAGMKSGTRSGLWSNMRDAIATIRPSLVVWENVRGSLSADADSDMEPCAGCVGGDDDGPVLRALGRVLGDLADIGYDAAWVGLRAADVGAPHGRFRIFVLGWPAADASSLGHEWARAARDGRAGSADGDSRTDRLTLLPTPAVNDMSAGKTVDAWDAWTDAMRAKHGNGNGHGASLSIEALRLLPTPTTQPTTGNGHARDLGSEVTALLPTPRATDGTKGGPNQRGSSGDLMLPSAAFQIHAKNGENDGDTDSASAGEVLRELRRADGTEAVQRETRGPGSLPAASVLRDELWGNPADSDEGCAALASTEVSGGRVHRMLDDGAPACAPCRPESCEQRPGESDDAVRIVPPALALAGGPSEAHGGVRSRFSDSAAAWGQYAPAIARWEMVLDRPAPSPTEPTGRDGSHRLSAHAAEFMMGLPAGWITDVDISRNDMLKAIGNGVVPQQCAAAVRHLLGVMATAVAA